MPNLTKKEGRKMATFYNQATLSYGGVVQNSNITSGEIISGVTLTTQRNCLTVINTGGNGNNDTLLLLYAARTVTVLTGLVDDLTLTAAGSTLLG